MQTHIARKDRSVRSWAKEIDDNAMQQALRSARSDAVADDIALMPDAHWGMGATVGSVIPTESAIIPAAVGVDIGCGMIASELNLNAADLPDTLDPLLSNIGRSVPAGFNRHKNPPAAALQWMNTNPVPEAERVPDKQLRGAAHQLGTLGSGNHFVEVCLDERDVVWAVLHSGSRGIGNVMAQRHIKAAGRLCKELERSLEDRDLAYFLDTDTQFGDYIADMLWAQAYARQNRELMMDAVLNQLGRAVAKPMVEARRINCHHNYTEREVHSGRHLWITRKGAIRAGVDDWGVIPGSMGAASYIVRGLGNVASYCSASHGAGRRHGRKEAKRRFSVDQFEDAMTQAGSTWQANAAEKLLDEAPMAYKDIDEVMAAQADLVEVRHRLRAVLNFKGF